MSENSGPESGAVERLLTEAEVAELLRVSLMSVKRLIQKGKLAAVKVGRFWRIRPSDLLAYQRRFQSNVIFLARRSKNTDPKS